MLSTNKLTGGQTNYYLAQVPHPRREAQPPYQAECEDIILALGMTFDEACIFKAIWRSANARKGNGKPDHKAIYDAEKMVHYSKQNLTRLRNEDADMKLLALDERLYRLLKEKLPIWHEWKGGNCPVHKDTTVEYVTGFDPKCVSSSPARCLRWEHNGTGGDIIRYRSV